MHSLKELFKLLNGNLGGSLTIRCCCCLVAQSSLTLDDPMNCSIPGVPVLHYVREFAQIHIHWIGDAIQPSYPLSSPPPPAFNLSQHQGLFQWVSSSHQVTKVLGISASASVPSMTIPVNIHDWFPLGLTGLISLKSKGLSRVFSINTVQKHQFSPTPQFKSTDSSVLSFLYSPAFTSTHDYWKNHSFD